MATPEDTTPASHEENEHMSESRSSESGSEAEATHQDGSESDAEDDNGDASGSDDEDEKPSKKLKFDKRLQAVTEALEDVEPPGAYLTDGIHAIFPQPAITLEGLGVVPLPVVGEAAKALIDKCRLSPYGHGEKTIVNTQVRNTWELSADQFRLDNPSWNAFIQEQIVLSIRVPLGIHESVQFEAKLYKLLLYETGGEFEKHKDSEKEDGMFGTLVVVLPGAFKGGELVVHDPSFASGGDSSQARKPTVWDPAAMDPHAIKYAAFYGDCPHEVKPVTSGYRVCLTYNLVVVSQIVEAEPRFGVNHPKYAALTSSLCDFFRDKRVDEAKRQRVDKNGASRATGFDITNPATHRFTKLVYVLSHKYTKAGLSFQYLKNKDALVATSLAQFCEDSNGAFALYLCKIKYDFSWEGQPDTWYDSDGSGSEADACKSLHLRSPWVEYAGFVGKGLAPGTERTVDVPDNDKKKMWGDLEDEVAPAGLFEAYDFEFDGKNEQQYTGNEGAVLEKWYSSAALVVVTVKERAKLAFIRDATEALREWVATVDTDASRATAMASGFSVVPRNWSLKGAENLLHVVVDAVVTMKRLSVLRDIMLSCERVDFQPQLRQLTQTFCHEAVASTITEMGKVWATRFANVDSHANWRARNCMNMVASVLDGETDATAVKTILNSVELKPFIARPQSYGDVDYYFTDTLPKEYARLLNLASVVSVEQVKLLLPKTDTRTLLMVEAPAVLHFHKMMAASTPVTLAPDELREIVTFVCDRLQANLPSLRNWPYEDQYDLWHCNQHKTCQCQVMKKFLMSTGESIELDTASVDSHLWPLVKKRQYLKKQLSVEVSEETKGKSIVTKTFENKLFLKAHEHWLALGELLQN